MIASTEEYVTLINDINELMRTRHEVPLFLRGYESLTLSGGKKETFQLIPATSFADLAQNEQSFSTDPAFSELKTRLGSTTQSLNRIYLKAIRFDGTNSPGWLINTFVDSSDESNLLKRVVELKSLLSKHGIETAKINAFRSIVGSSQLSHLVSINLASVNQLGEVIDILALESWDWELSDPLHQKCSVIKSGVYREISP